MKKIVLVLFMVIGLIAWKETKSSSDSIEVQTGEKIEKEVFEKVGKWTWCCRSHGLNSCSRTKKKFSDYKSCNKYNRAHKKANPKHSCGCW